MEYDFCGWATKFNVKCSDGRTIRSEAFKHCDGMEVPLIWNHVHNDPLNVLGKVTLQHRNEGIYAYGSFNETQSGQEAKKLLEHGDIDSLSIYANQLKEMNNNVIHGQIREVSLVLAGANPTARIESVMMHSDDSDNDSAVIYSGESLEMYHAEEIQNEEGENEMADELVHSDEATIKDVVDSMNEDQKNALYFLIGKALEQQSSEDEGGDEEMKHNLFDQEQEVGNVLSHSDEQAIINLAKSKNVGSLQQAINEYTEGGHLAHGFDDIAESLFPGAAFGPALHDPVSGMPELLTDDQAWVTHVMNKVHKSPYSRIRVRHAEARAKQLEEELRAKGYKKGEEKTLMDSIKLLKRTTDPQTIYIKDALHRDDIIDIEDFDAIAYQYKIMEMVLKREIATAILLGDGRTSIDPDKIDESHIRPIWTDNDFYAIHKDVDFAKMRQELQGTDTAKHFGDEFVYTEALIKTILDARIEYRGSGNLDMYCTEYLLNKLLLARDMNGRRIYANKAELTAALNVNSIQVVETFEGKVRKDSQGKDHKLVCMLVNLNDYQVGCAKGGQITKFQQFDIDFNREKLLMETRLSGSLLKPYAAIVLEELVTTPNAG